MVAPQKYIFFKILHYHPVWWRECFCLHTLEKTLMFWISLSELRLNYQGLESTTGVLLFSSQISVSLFLTEMVVLHFFHEKRIAPDLHVLFHSKCTVSRTDKSHSLVQQAVPSVFNGDLLKWGSFFFGSLFIYFFLWHVFSTIRLSSTNLKINFKLLFHTVWRWLGNPDCFLRMEFPSTLAQL